MEKEQVLSHLQAGFRAKTSTIDQVFCFLLIVWKSVVLNKEHMYVVFVDLCAAFDLIPWGKLWVALEDMGMPINLLHIVLRLHTDNYTQVRWGRNGELSEHISVNRGANKDTF